MLLAPLLFQTVSSPHATSAPLFCGQFVLTFPTLQSEIYSWPFLCCSTPFTHASLKSHSPRSCWGPVSFWLAASAIFTVLSLSNWSLRKKCIRNRALMDRQVRWHAQQPRMSVLVGNIRSLQPV